MKPATKASAFIPHPSALIPVFLERETRLELATLALARRCSTTELLPLFGLMILSNQRRRFKCDRTRKGPTDLTRIPADKTIRENPSGPILQFSVL